MFDHGARRSRLDERLRAEGIDALFLPVSSDLEYLTELASRRAGARRERRLPRSDRRRTLGEHFRHRMGHGIGLVHERPFLSEEDETPLEVGMTFTDEPSVLRAPASKT